VYNFCVSDVDELIIASIREVVLWQENIVCVAAKSTCFLMLQYNPTNQKFDPGQEYQCRNTSQILFRSKKISKNTRPIFSFFKIHDQGLAYGGQDYKYKKAGAPQHYYSSTG